MAIFTKDHLQCSVVSTKSVPKQFDLLVLTIKLSNSSLLTVAGCYRPPSAPACTLPALSSYFKEQFSLCGSNPKKFWKKVKYLGNKPSSSQLPMSLKVDDVVVTDKKHMAELFNHHFIKSGFLFDSAMPHCPSNISSSPTPSNATSPDAPPSFSTAPLQSFSLRAVSKS